jgi:hypothetical protein
MINYYFRLFLMLTSFTIAFLGVVILFNFDPVTGMLMSVGGIVLSLKTIGGV